MKVVPRVKQVHVKPQALNEIRATRRCGIVHSDVLGPVSIESLNGKRFMISFTDDMTRCSQVYFMNSKSEALDKFKEYQGSVEGTSGELIRIVHTDRGGEYMSKEFKRYLVHQKIEHEETCAHSPEQNGVAERLNRTLMEKARPMVAHAGVGKAFWAEAVHTANYLKNRTPMKALGMKTPYKAWYGKQPDLLNLRVFSCMAFAHVPDVLRKKLDDKAVKLRFMGYSKGGKGYRLMHEDNRRITYRRDVTFNELCFSFNPTVVTGNETNTVIHGKGNSEPTVEPQPEPVESGST